MIVVDCSAVVDALTGVTGSGELRQRLRQEELHAPALIDFEFVSAVRRMTFSKKLRADRAADVLGDFEDLPLLRWQQGDGLRRRVYSLRNEVNAYDAAYVALADALDCELVTRDARLARTGGHSVSFQLL